MSWRAVARKDFRDAIRSRAFWAISALFVLLAVGVSAAYGFFPEELGTDGSPRGLAFFLANVISTFVAITAILLCYKSLAGERESGSIKLLLSLPHSRGEVVFGKVVGRTGVLAVPVIGALLLGTVLGSLLIGAVDPVATATLLAVALFFALTYVSAMVGFSAMTGSATRAAVLTIGAFFVFEVLWDVVVLAAVFVGSGFSLPSPAEFPAWVYPLTQVTPSSAFLSTLNAVTPGATSVGGGLVDPGALDAFYASPWIGAVSLLLWLVVPIAIGTRLFRGADL